MDSILCGNSLDVLKTLESNSVDCIITSPPYYQLRKYGDSNEEIGQEDTPLEFIQNLKLIFDQCYRVLKDDGTMFINISDTYVGTGVKNPNTIKTKSLMGIPSRLEIALIDSGWILRNEIIWHKPNAMPQSVKDRFTVDFEKIFFFTKTGKYHFKQIKELMKTQDLSQPRGSDGVVGQKNSGRRKQDELGKGTYTGFNQRYTPTQDGMRNKRTVWSISTEASSLEHFAMYPKELVETML
jgi:DNA modification methylase